MSVPRVVEKYYSPAELSGLVGFAPSFWRDLAKRGELTLADGENNTIAEPLFVAGEIRIPASCVNAFLLRHPLRYDPGVKARNKAELQRKLVGSAVSG